jgi:hypothetical protein
MRALATAHYASPEQLRRAPDLDARTDIYSLGCTWFHLLTGRVPFPAPSSAAIAARHIHDPFPDPWDSRATPSDTLRATAGILRRMCAKARDDRYPDPSSLLADLEDLERALARGATGAAGFARAILDRLVRRPAAAPEAPFAAPGELARRLGDLQEENARLFCERDLLRHEMLQDEARIEHLEGENARLACSCDLLDIEVRALRGAMDGLRLRREAQRRARSVRGDSAG